MAWRKWASAAVASIALGGSASAAEPLGADLIGSWRLVAVYDQFADGSRRDTWGSEPQGLVVFTKEGLFSVLIVGRGRAPHANAVPSEPVGPAIAYYGTYTVDETKRQFVTRVEQSTFPQWTGATLTRTVERIEADRIEVTAQPIRDPAKGEFVPHLTLARVK